MVEKGGIATCTYKTTGGISPFSNIWAFSVFFRTRPSHKTGFFFLNQVEPPKPPYSPSEPDSTPLDSLEEVPLDSGAGVPRRLQPGGCQTGFVHHRLGHGKVPNPVARVLGHATVRLVGVTAVRLEAPAVGAGEGADAPGHAVGLVLGEALLDSRDDIFPGGHGLDAHVAHFLRRRHG